MELVFLLYRLGYIGTWGFRDMPTPAQLVASRDFSWGQEDWRLSCFPPSFPSPLGTEAGRGPGGRAGGGDMQSQSIRQDDTGWQSQVPQMRGCEVPGANRGYGLWAGQVTGGLLSHICPQRKRQGWPCESHWSQSPRVCDGQEHTWEAGRMWCPWTLASSEMEKQEEQLPVTQLLLWARPLLHSAVHVRSEWSETQRG